MRILVIRHGQSEADLLGVHEGRADFGLTGLGKAQADAMARWIAEEYTPDWIYSSTLQRARDTAAALIRHTRAPVLYLPELMEQDNGLLAGLPFEEARVKHPPADDLPPHKALYKMEPPLDFRFRMERVLSKILSENEASATVALISHGGAINMLWRAFLGLPVGSGISFSTGDTGVHLWEIEGSARRVLFSNRTGHLASLAQGRE